VVDKLGARAVKNSLRLFMVPGMGHCNGGDGTDSFDMLSAIEKWVEQGKAPDRIEAARVRDGKTDRTRPLCPYPQVASYKGWGSTDDAANFVCSVR
jgi:feruloyl esterase